MALSRDLRKHALAVQKDLIITPRLIGHMATERALVDDMHLPTVMQLLQDRGHRAKGWHPSQLYTCPRSQVFAWHGMPGNESKRSMNSASIFLDGHWRHVKWQATLLAAGILHSVEVPVQHKLTNIVGTMDGLGSPYHIYDEWIFEAKGTSQFDQIKRYGALPSHIQQLHAYFIAYDGTDTGVIFYEDKASNDIHEIVVRRDQAVETEIRKRVGKLNAAVADRKLPEVLDECLYGEGAYKQCPYAYACKQVGWDEAEAAGACHSSKAVIVKLGLSRRNRHDSPPPESGAGGRGNPVVARFAKRAGSVPASPARTIRVPLRQRRDDADGVRQRRVLKGHGGHHDAAADGE